MGWPKGQSRKTESVVVNGPATGGENGITKPEAVNVTSAAEPTTEVAAPTVTMTMAEVQAMIADGVKKGLENLNAIKPIDDTGFWQATRRTQSEIFGCIEADRIIFLSPEHEAKLGLGKPLAKGYTPNFKKPNQQDLQEALRRGDITGAVPQQDGMAILPPAHVSQSLDPEKNDFRLLSMKS